EDYPEGCDDMIEMIAVIEPPEDCKLEQQAECERREKRKHCRQQKIPGQRIERDCKVSPHHILHAVCEVDEIHYAEDEGEAGGDQKKKNAELEAVEDLNDEESGVHAQRCSRLGIPALKVEIDRRERGERWSVGASGIIRAREEPPSKRCRVAALRPGR